MSHHLHRGLRLPQHRLLRRTRLPGEATQRRGVLCQQPMHVRLLRRRRVLQLGVLRQLRSLRSAGQPGQVHARRRREPGRSRLRAVRLRRQDRELSERVHHGRELRRRRLLLQRPVRAQARSGCVLRRHTRVHIRLLRQWRVLQLHVHGRVRTLRCHGGSVPAAGVRRRRQQQRVSAVCLRRAHRYVPDVVLIRCELHHRGLLRRRARAVSPTQAAGPGLRLHGRVHLRLLRGRRVLRLPLRRPVRVMHGDRPRRHLFRGARATRRWPVRVRRRRQSLQWPLRWSPDRRLCVPVDRYAVPCGSLLHRRRDRVGQL